MLNFFDKLHCILPTYKQYIYYIILYLLFKYLPPLFYILIVYTIYDGNWYIF
jgi:hypothetical protein